MGTGFSTVKELGINYNESETVSLLWLDAQMNRTDENRRAQDQFRKLIDNFKTFDKEDDCLQYISNINLDEKIIFIISGRLGRSIIPQIHSLKQIISIYIYCMDKEANEQWSKQFTKVLHLCQ